MSKPPVIRCAIYTRKSTDEGLEQEFNSLDAQREAGEAFIASQKHEGWHCLNERYDDGGFTGGNMERPAMRRLMNDIEEGRIDCVVVYKVDRLSRSLLDFARIMSTFDKHGVSFVSVTQQFNTTSSMGRLTLNILLSFAQFEREIISERTRDKIAATRRKGKWSGGTPVLGYDLDPNITRLVLNKDEAEIVRAIFDIYLERESLIETIAELDARGWGTKTWVTRKGIKRGGAPFTKNTLRRHLTNVLYIGKMTYKDEIHNGEQPAIVDADTFKRVQRLLKRNAHTGGVTARNQFGALLKGLIHCDACDCKMMHTHTTKNKTKRYRYYVCLNAQKRGWANCPAPSVPAQEIERFVAEQIKCIGSDSELITKTFEESRRQQDAALKDLEKQKHVLSRELYRDNEALRKLVLDSSNGDVATDRLADLQERIRLNGQRTAEINDKIAVLNHELIKEEDVASVCSMFDPAWETLTPHEQARIIHLLVERVDYNGEDGNIAITFYPTGIKVLADELDNKEIVA